MSRIWTSFRAWVKGMRQAWSRHIIPVVVVAVAFGMLQKPLLALLSFIESTCLAHLSPDWFGGFVFLLACYLLKREWDYRKIYVPRPVSLWLILLLGIYLYYRHWEGSFSFWPISFSFWEIPYLRKLAWSDLLLLPWGGAVAIALRPRSKEDYWSIAILLRSKSKKDYWGIGITLVILCVLGYFLRQGQGASLLGRPLGSIAIAVGACLLGYFILYRWSDRLQPELKEEAQKETELSSLAIDTDNAIVREKEDWLGFSGMAWILCRNLEMLDLHERSLAVGVIAPWGRGKSSFVNLLKELLEQDDRVVVTFNPRGSKSVSSIPEDFFDTFAKELSRHYLGFGLLLARYTKHLGLLNQYEWTRPLGSLLTLILPGKEQEAVNRTLRELGKRVYVLLDDLDRLSAEEILEVLKLMDRNASFSNTVFITAYDKAYVNNVLKKHLDHGLTHSFIDKYISWEFPLPEPNKETLERLVGEALSRKVYPALTSMYRHVQRSWSQIGSIVVESLDSVRDLKRYLNLVIPRYNGVFRAVDCGDFFLLYLLCYKDFSIYLALHSRRILQLDVSSHTYVLISNYEEELKQVSQWEGSKSILERIFLLKPEEEEDDPWRCSLRHVSSFDAYFRGIEFEENSPYGDVLHRIVFPMSIQTSFEAIDNLIEELGIERVVGAFLYLVSLPLQRNEDRTETIKAIAYMAFVRNLPERSSFVLKGELLKFLSWDSYRSNEELGVIRGLDAYKHLLNPMLTFVVQVNPQWISDVINVFNLGGGRSSERYVYTAKELSKLLSDHQKS